MGRIFKWVGIFIALLVVAAVCLPFLINVNQFKPMLESELSRALNRDVKLGTLKLSLLAGEVRADDLMVSDDPAFAKPAFIRAHSLRVGAELWPFLMSLSANLAGGGTIQLKGTAGPIHPTDAAMTPLHAMIELAQVDLVRSGLNDFAPDLAGIVSLNAAAESDGRDMHVTGKLSA